MQAFTVGIAPDSSIGPAPTHAHYTTATTPSQGERRGRRWKERGGGGEKRERNVLPLIRAGGTHAENTR